MNWTLPLRCLMAILLLLPTACGDSGGPGATGDTPADAGTGGGGDVAPDDHDATDDPGLEDALSDHADTIEDVGDPGPEDSDAAPGDAGPDATPAPDADVALVDVGQDAAPEIVQDVTPDSGVPDAPDAGPDASSPPDADDAVEDSEEIIEPDCATADDCEPALATCQVVACVAGECVLEDAADGSTCDDQLACTVGDSCQAGACEPGVTPDCSGLAATCVAGACDPGTGGCVAVPVDDGTPCNDGNACTALDSCQAGTCGGSPVVCSNLDEGCLDGACDPDTGDCLQVPTVDGTVCDDEDACTTQDACVSGACAGTEVVCEASECETASCDAGTGKCVVNAIDDGATCSDGDPCTTGDACAAGDCVGAAVDCTSLDGACVTGVCDAGSGECVPTAAEDGAECDDEDACTSGDLCAGGTCSGQALECGDLDTPCGFGGCDVATGTCVLQVLEDGSGCDDSDACTAGDTCVGGTCSGTPPDCSDLDGDCVVGACDGATGGCVEAVAEDGTTCDSGEPCTVGAVCSGGVCGGDTIDCTGLDDACNFGICDEDTLTCLTVPKDDGGTPIACDDEDPCTANDVCGSGTCAGALVDCSELDAACLVGACDGLTGECLAAPRADGEDCDDLDACTVDDACVTGTCEGAAVDCADLDGPCLLGVCSPATGTCEAEELADAEPCDDEDPCTDGDLCGAGICAGPPKSCPSAGPCFEATCNGDSGICEQSLVQDNTICDDGDICTGGDACQGGVCAGALIDCDAETEVCFESFCDSATGLCVTAAVQDGTDCVDSDPCLSAAVCVNGMCLGSDKDCSAFDGSCVVGACSPIAGDCYAKAIPDFLGCDDQSVCTSGDHCEDGECVGVEVDCSFAGDACNVGVCDPVAGTCGQAPAFDGEPCDDLNPCTEADSCSEGACGGAALDCSFLDQDCKVGACNPVTGGCVLQPAPGGTGCDDNDACTELDVCAGSTCVGSPVDCTLPGGSCFTGSCDPGQGGCIQTPREDGSDCDDDDTCTVADVCLDAACVGELLDCTIYDGPCTTGLCDGVTAACQLVIAEIGAPCSDDNPCTTDDICIDATCIGDYDDTIAGCGGAATCLSPIPISAVPYETADATDDGTVDFEASGCGIGATGSDGLEQLYRLEAPESGIFVVQLLTPPEGSTLFDSILYAFDSCPGVEEASCLGGDDAPGAGAAELIALPLAAGESAWIVVDGAAADQAGDYLLTVELAPSAEVVCDDGLDLDYDGATDCQDLDCLGIGGCLPALPVGSLAFVEVMAHPVDPLGAAGEWIEIRSTSDVDLSLEGVSLAVRSWAPGAPTPAAPDAAAALSGAGLVEAGERLVLAVANTPADNGFISSSVSYTGLALSDSGNLMLQLVSPGWDGVTAPPPQLVIDSVTIPAATFAEGAPGSGASWQLSGDLELGATAAFNDEATNWCYTPAEVEHEYFTNNHGTPAAENLVCDAFVDYASVQVVLQAKCTPCHEGPGPCSGGVCFVTDYADTQVPSNVCADKHVFECMLQRVQEGSMPFGKGCSGDPVIDAQFPDCLDGADQAVLEQWVEQGGVE